MAGIDLLHVPFKGGGPAMIDVIGGHTKLVFATTITALPHVRAGKLRALRSGRDAAQPRPAGVPTIAEAGVPGYQAVNWIGIVAPAGTPAAIVADSTRRFPRSRIRRKSSSSSAGVEVLRMGSSDFAAFMTAELRKWERVVKEGGIKAE